MKQASKNEYLINGIDPYDFTEEKVRYSKLYTKHVPWSTCTYVQFVFNIGAMHDPKGKEGLAHFLEHMVFAGSPSFQTKFDLDQFSKTQTLDSLNANTSFANTCFHFRCLPEQLEDALNGVLEIITKPLLREEDVVQEKEIIIREAWDSFKNEKAISFKKREVKNLFKDFPDKLRVPYAIGWPDTIQNIEKKDLEIALRNYVQQNLSVVLSGYVTKKEKKMVQDIINKIPAGKKVKEVYVPKVVHAPTERVWIHTYEEMGRSDVNQAYVEISCGRELKATKGKTGAMILARALLYEILFRELRHKNSWCYSVGAGFGNSVDYTYGEMHTKVDVAHALESVQIMRRIVEDIVQGSYKDEFLQEKSLVIERKRAVELVTSDIVDMAVQTLRHRDTIDTRKESFDMLYKTTFKDVQKLIKDTFMNKKWIVDVRTPNSFNTKKLSADIAKLIS